MTQAVSVTVIDPFQFLEDTPTALSLDELKEALLDDGLMHGNNPLLPRLHPLVGFGGLNDYAGDFIGFSWPTI